MQFGFGAGRLYATRTDIVAQPPIVFGAFQDMSLSFKGDLKQLFGQNQYSLSAARGKVSIEGKAKFAQFSAPLVNAVFFGGTIAAGQTIAEYHEAGTIPAVSTYEVTTTHSATWVADLAVYDVLTGNQMVQVASAPITGEYSVAAGVYTFAAADEGNAVLIDYTYTATAGFTMTAGNPLMGNTPKFSASFAQTFEGNNLLITMPTCVGTNFTLPTKQDDYAVEEFDFTVTAGSGSPFIMASTL
jgi:hypothetical protein